MRVVRLRIKELMKEYELTQAELSDKSGVRQSAISEMSRNIREQVSLIHLTKIAHALEIDDISKLLEITYINRIGFSDDYLAGKLLRESEEDK